MAAAWNVRLQVLSLQGLIAKRMQSRLAWSVAPRDAPRGLELQELQNRASRAAAKLRARACRYARSPCVTLAMRAFHHFGETVTYLVDLRLERSLFV